MIRCSANLRAGIVFFALAALCELNFAPAVPHAVAETDPCLDHLSRQAQATDSAAANTASAVTPITDCVPLNVGESRVVNFDRRRSPTGVPVRFRLLRTGERNYTIQYRLEFEPAIRDAVTDRVFQCFSRVNSILE